MSPLTGLAIMSNSTQRFRAGLTLFCPLRGLVFADSDALQFLK
jgi:hypothetical protein